MVKIALSENAFCRGRLSAVDLLIKIRCLVKKENSFGIDNVLNRLINGMYRLSSLALLVPLVAATKIHFEEPAGTKQTSELTRLAGGQGLSRKSKAAILGKLPETKPLTLAQTRRQIKKVI
jgi:hypothetical protein